MKAADARLEPLFAMPFGTVRMRDADAANGELLQLFARRSNAGVQDRSAGSNPLCLQSRADFLDWSDPPVPLLKRQMLSGIASVVAAANLYTPSEFDALTFHVRGWYSLIQQFGGVSINSHAHCSWCAVYCVSAPPPSEARFDSGALRLYETRLAGSFIDAGSWRMRAPYGYGHHVWNPVAGHMVVFPGAAPYEIAPLYGEGTLAIVTAQIQITTPQQQGALPW